ncbi:TPA: hypothetical protein DEB00_03595 [Candidatus Uhrbacteria bacterium]|nr:hypothetical protein [Candidatus Uhrbacteria bacterium]
MKRLDLFFAGIRVPIDAAVIVLAGWTAYWIRIHPRVAEVLPVRFNIDVNELLRVVLGVAIFWILIFTANRLYSVKRRSVREEVGRVIYAVSTGMMLVFTVIFFSREIFDSRFIVLVAWVLAMFFVILARLLLRLLQRLLLSRGFGQRHVILIGPKEETAPLLDEFGAKPGLGFYVIGTRTQFDQETQSWIIRKKHKGSVDEIIFANPDANRKEALKLLAFCEQQHINFYYTADLLEASTSKLEPHTFAGIPLFEVKQTPLDGWGRIYKRTFDLIVSLLLILLSSPLQLIVAMILIGERQGGILFRKLPNGKPVQRVGEGGKPFTFIKFRSMVKDAHKLRFDKDFLAEHGNERAGTPLFKLEHDPRITRFGQLIRRTSIDELPQLYLALFGKMSLVGPRPHFPEEVAQYKPEHLKVLTIKPGITGMAQVSGRADLDFNDEVRLDTYYIENWSPLLDLQILAKTAWVVLLSRGAK